MKKRKAGDSVEFKVKKAHRYGVVKVYGGDRYGIRDSEDKVVKRSGSALAEGPPFSPLFPDLFACDIRFLKVYRSGPTRRELLSTPAGFEFDPYTTTEQDIIKHFGTGRLILEPAGHNYKIMPGRGLVTASNSDLRKACDELLALANKLSKLVPR